MLMMHNKVGFSLLEMAIVLLVVGILMAAGLGALNVQISQRRWNETQQMLRAANEALIGFALSNNRLPCPADPSLANTAANAGKEARNGAGANAYRCSLVFGDLPWQDLGLPELDAWGGRLQYQVTTSTTGGAGSSYANDLAGRDDAGTPNCGSSAMKPCFTLATLGKIAVYSASRRDGQAVSAIKRIDDAAAVVFSGGPNGVGSSADELENRDAIADGSTPRFVQDAPDAEFDDLLTWLPTTILYYRLVSAERLP
ncbi:type II secretion system protein [Deefgea piscis]|uniref:Type II secretion system protein n=1 Tax=Deefgea piscis TaxID=2739061 RepID=A0A6M8SVI1_9NEIS|nr:type II secretion system protein [Deefgea piscis]QKJ66679.1 type II secretion system protein [Deefgea piscis]